MKHLLTVAAVLVLLAAAPAAPAQQQADVKEFLQNLWGKLRALTPRSGPPPETTATVTAGLRGAEATESELRPYWRGGEPPARSEMLALERAQAAADAGKFSEAAQAFEAFLQANPRSALAPNALFGAALARAAMGDGARATAAFEEFIKREPGHPLAGDAKQALAALR
jgi:TolA-binding protein